MSNQYLEEILSEKPEDKDKMQRLRPGAELHRKT